MTQCAPDWIGHPGVLKRPSRSYILGSVATNEGIDVNRNRLGTAIALSILSFSAAAETHAAQSAAARAAMQQAEASMVVTGDVSIDAAGHVIGYSLDQPEKIPAGVSGLIAQYVPRWAFEPVQKDGSPVPAKAGMRLRVVAHKTDETHYAVAIRSAAFSDPANEVLPGASLSAKKMTPPHYPAAAYGIDGTVYLRLKIDRSGNVADEIAEQVTLHAVGTTQEMDAWRDALAKNTVKAAARWTFNPPTAGKLTSRAYWDVVVPVVYTMEGDPIPGYGQWEAYIPGPRQDIPWADPDDSTRPHSSEAYAEGSPHLAGGGLHLLTPLTEG